MKFPFVIIKNLSDFQIEIWKKFYNKTKNHNPRIEEGIWRRTQDEENKKDSGWKSSKDQRRRMVHYQHEFDVIKRKDGSKDLVLNKSYLWVSVCLPSREILEYKKALKEISKEFEIVQRSISLDDEVVVLRNKDVYIDIRFYKKHPEDTKEKRVISKNYNSLDITIYSNNFTIDDEFQNKPWYILKTGFRKKDIRKEPITGNVIEKISSLLPAHIELGCGPSIEAGIPPLKFLHDVYKVTDLESKISIFNLPKDTLLLEVMSNPQEAYLRLTEMYKKCFLARPTKFHEIVRELVSRRLIVGEIITNNFDGLVRKAGLEERYIRKYESTHIIPKIKFNKNAKSLIVVGVHADRRKIHHAARKKGLAVIYIDPEGYHGLGKFECYPLEGPQSNDILFREGATKAFELIYENINKKIQ